MRRDVKLAASSVASVLVVSTLLGAGCQYDQEVAEAPSGAALAAVAAQVEAGGVVYANSCSMCHGADGEGGRGPALVGEGAFPLDPRPRSRRPGQFRTAMDIATFATQNMPPNETMRAAMSEADYWAVLAFALSANDVSLSEPVGPDNAGSIVLHP